MNRGRKQDGVFRRAGGKAIEIPSCGNLHRSYKCSVMAPSESVLMRIMPYHAKVLVGQADL